MLSFAQTLYAELRELFEEDEIEILLSRPNPNDGPGSFEKAVRIAHKETGITVDVDEFPTQIENGALAKIRLFHRVRRERKAHD